MPTQKSQTRANATPSPAIVKAITTLYVVNQAASVLPWLVGAAVGGRCIVSVRVAFCARCARVLSAMVVPFVLGSPPTLSDLGSAARRPPVQVRTGRRPGSGRPSRRARQDRPSRRERPARRTRAGGTVPPSVGTPAPARRRRGRR